MDSTKIRLSPEEAALVERDDWILTKNGILIKVKLLLEELQTAEYNFIELHRETIPAAAIQSAAKISRGENYRGLPYLILDQPRIFGVTDMFAIRTFFWWGNFFSCTLLLSGTHADTYRDSLVANYHQLKEGKYYISLHESPWEHHFDADNFRLVAELTKEEFAARLKNHPFIKISWKMALHEWNSVNSMLYKIFVEYIGMLGLSRLSSRDDEKDL